ncbi:MAG: bacteriohemerythrin [Patescibacteria group bacterium]
MEKYKWVEKYSVGVEELDAQHQHYFEIVSEVIKMTGQEKIVLNDLLVKIDDLNNYSIYHFTTEENLFKHYAYPDAEEHIAAHNTYEEKMDTFIADANREGADTKKIVLEIAEFAGSWLVNHIMVIDQKYIKFMHEKGIK